MSRMFRSLQILTVIRPNQGFLRVTVDRAQESRDVCVTHYVSALVSDDGDDALDRDRRRC